MLRVATRGIARGLIPCVSFLFPDSQDDQTSHSGDASHHDAFSKYWFEMAIEMPSDEEGAGPESPVSISSTTTVFTSLDHSPTLYYRGVRRKDSVCELIDREGGGGERVVGEREVVGAGESRWEGREDGRGGRAHEQGWLESR